MVITAIEGQKKNKKRKSVFIDGVFAFGIDEFDLFKLKLKTGNEISKEELANIRETVLFSDAKEYAAGLCAKFFYTSKGIYDKLRSRSYDEETISKVIVFLKEYKLIDDFEFARRFINDALKIKGMGMEKIKYELYLKGIGREIAEKAAEEFDVYTLECEKILLLAEKKLANNFEYKNIAKTKRYLFSKGYQSDMIDDAIRKIVQKSEDYDA